MILYTNFLPRLLATMVPAALATLAGCATEMKQEPIAISEAPSAYASVVFDGIETAQRALPTLVTNTTQKAHYDHVYVDSQDVNARSLKTIPLTDAIAHDVLASSEKPVIRQELDPSKLTWIVSGKPDLRPTSLEGVGGYGVADATYVEVNFDVDKTEILNKENVQTLIDKAARVSGMFYVVGYADKTGIEAKNQTLSSNRATSVKSLLTEASINESRILDSGAGVSTTYPDLAANRRTAITFKIDPTP